MEKKEDLIKESASIIEEIEDQLDKILTKKREEIETELEAKIERDRKEAEEKMKRVETDLAGEREAVSSYKTVLSEFEKNKKELKDKINVHMAKAMEYQPQIEKLAADTLEELKAVFELNKKLEELNLYAVTQVDTLKKKLEERFQISPPAPETKEHEEVQNNLDLELAKLQKIKELLGKNSRVRKDLTEFNAESMPEKVGTEKEDPLESSAEFEQPRITEESLPEEEKCFPEEEVKESEPEPMPEPEMGPQPEPEPMSEPEVEPRPEPKPVVEPETEPQPEPEPVQKPEPEPQVTEKVDASVDAALEPPEVLRDKLDKFRRSTEGEKNSNLTYFENNKKIILEGNDILASMEAGIDQAKKLYDKLEKTKSPKEQFFTKQEIIWHQETLREFVLTAVKMCEKENAALPQYTAEVMSKDTLNEILEKLSQENWSNKDFFTSFTQYTHELKSRYQEKTTPPSRYLKSLVEELGID